MFWVEILSYKIVINKTHINEVIGGTNNPIITEVKNKVISIVQTDNDGVYKYFWFIVGQSP